VTSSTCTNISTFYSTIATKNSLLANNLEHDINLNVHLVFCSKSLDLHLSVCILRVSGGLDFSTKITFGKETNLSPSSNYSDLSKSNASLPKNLSDQSFYAVSQGKPGALK